MTQLHKQGQEAYRSGYIERDEPLWEESWDDWPLKKKVVTEPSEMKLQANVMTNYANPN